MLFDLEWLGIEWDGVPRRQSEHFDEYREGLETLAEAGMIYPSFISRGEIRKLAAEKGPDWPTDPDGAPIYPGDERHWSAEKRAMFELEAPAKNQRLAMDKAIAMVAGPLHWLDTGAGPDGETGDITARPEAWGDLVIARQGTPTSYHLSVVLDDALQGVTNVVRGSDVFHATSVHRLLQHLLGIPAPVYHHHELILDQTGRKLSKSLEDTSLRALRESGATPQDLRRMIGL